jgi:phage/conjugal plasmid C-4 type zinc finger TraR family protein
MTDVFDRAQAIDLAEWEARNMHRTQLPTDWEHLSLKWCAGCGQRIPDERRKAVPGAQLCVRCQADTEHFNQQHGKRR